MKKTFSRLKYFLDERLFEIKSNTLKKKLMRHYPNEKFQNLSCIFKKKHTTLFKKNKNVVNINFNNTLDNPLSAQIN